MDGWMGAFVSSAVVNDDRTNIERRKWKGGWYSVASGRESGALFGGQFETSPITRELLVPPSARIFNYRRARRNSPWRMASSKLCREMVAGLCVEWFPNRIIPPSPAIKRRTSSKRFPFGNCRAYIHRRPSKHFGRCVYCIAQLLLRLALFKKWNFIFPFFFYVFLGHPRKWIIVIAALVKIAATFTRVMMMMARDERHHKHLYMLLYGLCVCVCVYTCSFAYVRDMFQSRQVLLLLHTPTLSASTALLPSGISSALFGFVKRLNNPRRIN